MLHCLVLKVPKEPTYITLLEGVPGVADEVRPVDGPDPLVLSGLVLLLVVQLKLAKLTLAVKIDTVTD